jgi:probable rRNA maturation factor
MMRRLGRRIAAPPLPNATDGSATVEVYVADEQDDVPIDTGRWLRLATEVLAAQGVGRSGRDVEMSLLFVDEVTITAHNERFMGADGPTDVLSFPIDDESLDVPVGPNGSSPSLELDEDGDPDDLSVMLGDVVICPSVAVGNVAERLTPSRQPTDDEINDELALLVVHGILHLLGHDHEDADEATLMRTSEQIMLEAFHRPSGPPPAEVHP